MVTVCTDTVTDRLWARLWCSPRGLELRGGADGDGERGHGDESIAGPLAVHTVWTRAGWSCYGAVRFSTCWHVEKRTAVETTTKWVSVPDNAHTIALSRFSNTP
eukprot:3766326-Rhodomonas_salina.1